jgi:hypothetical protein
VLLVDGMGPDPNVDPPVAVVYQLRFVPLAVKADAVAFWQ